MNKIKTAICTGAITGLIAISSSASAEIGLTGKVGTLGLGVDLTYGIN